MCLFPFSREVSLCQAFLKDNVKGFGNVIVTNFQNSGWNAIMAMSFIWVKFPYVLGNIFFLTLSSLKFVEMFKGGSTLKVAIKVHCSLK